MYDNVGGRSRKHKRLARYPGIGVEPGSVSPGLRSEHG